MKLSDATVRALRPTDKQVMYRDDLISGFAVRVTPKGVRSFCLMHGPERTVTTIGRYPILSLSEAREVARRILAQKTLGTYQRRSIRFTDALDLFVQTHCAGIKTGYEYERMLRREFLPTLQSKTLDKITSHDIQSIIDDLSPSIAYHGFQYLKAFFTWSIQRSCLDHSPLVRMKAPKKGHARERVLTDDELRRVWIATEDLGTYAKIVRLLLLTGQRRGEIATLRPEFICNDTITLPKTKNGRTHQFPIGPLASSLVASSVLPNCSLLFSAPRDATKPFRQFCEAKLALDKLCGFSNWTLHDLRRTFCTRLAELGVAPHVIERLVNHVSGTLSPIARIYNRASYMPEMRAAVVLWEAHLKTLLSRVEHLNV